MATMYSVSLRVTCIWSLIMYVKAENEEGDLPLLSQ